MKLSILICSVPERKQMLMDLLKRFAKITSDDYSSDVEILWDGRAKDKISVGLKRQSLLEKACGKWIVFFDDDDCPSIGYVNYIVNTIDKFQDIDCIGIRGYMTTDGLNPKTWCHRLGYEIKGDGITPTEEGYDYVRPIIHFNPVLRKLALLAGFQDLRFGEDMDYAKRLNPLLQNEYFLDYDLFHYRYTTSVPHKEKYGL